MYHPIKQKNMQQLAEYQRLLFKKPRLKYLFFELTDRCNLNCMHCGSKCTEKNSIYLDYEVIIKTLTQVAGRYDTSQIMVCITGGEPLLHPDIYKIIRQAKQLGFFVGITTNGTLITDQEARLLKEAGLNTVAISIDGLGDVHNKLRGCKDAFDHAMRGVRSLKKEGIEPQALTVVHKDNIFQLDDICDFMKKEEFYSWRLVNIEPIGRAAINNRLLLDGDDLKSLFDFIRKKRFDPDNDMDVTFGCSHFLTFEYENELRDFYFQCGAGTTVASIMANGNIGACLDIERRADLVQGNIYQDDFINVWENRFTEFRIDRTERSRTCIHCKNRSVCMGDSAHTWDYDRNEPNYCVAKMIGGCDI